MKFRIKILTYLSDTVEILERLEDIDRFELLLMGELGLLEELPTDFLLRNMEEKAEVMEFFVARLASLPENRIQNSKPHNSGLLHQSEFFHYCEVFHYFDG